MQYSGTLYITATPTEADPTVFEFTDENIKKAKAFGLNLAKPILAEQYGIDPNSYVWNVELDALPTPTEAKQYPITGRVVQSGETDTGIYTGGTAVTPSISDIRKYPGTHEYSYAEQAFMLFAKRQNLIGVTGTRYRFEDIVSKMNTLSFEDRYSLTPNSNDRVVVLGPVSSVYDRNESSWTDADYDIGEINELLNALSETFVAKAYDITYNSYAELSVEDEMGFFVPQFLGLEYNRDTRSVQKAYTKANLGEGKNIDVALKNADMWGKDEHYSINDAIAALRQQLKVIDSDSSSHEGISGIFGGYKVNTTDVSIPGTDDITNGSTYSYYNNGVQVPESNPITSNFSLAAVLDALDNLAAEQLSNEVAVNSTNGKSSNRAIYVNIGDANVSASSYIYLLHNRNYRKISTDTEGVFSFVDKKGNKVYYQDKIFAGVEWLALVIIGNNGLVFVANRCGNKDVSKIAWMVSEGSFVTDKQAKALVSNGLIHTTDITVNNETFEATLSIKGMKVRKTTKTVDRYIPVLFLDTLKVSTIEQSAEEVYAQGGHGNTNLIGWDYGKAITLNLQDALFTPASMAATLGAYEGNDFRNGVKDTKQIDRMEKVIAKRSFIVPAGNQNGTPTEADKTAQAVFYDPNTMEPYADGTPIAEGEIFYKYTRSIAYGDNSIGKTIEISADKFPGTYKIVGDTYVRSKRNGEDERFQFVIPQAKMQSNQTIELQADGDPVVFDMNMTVLRPDDGVMVKFIQYNVVENTEENDGSTMVKGTENLNLLDDAELFKVSAASIDSDDYIGATEY